MDTRRLSSGNNSKICSVKDAVFGLYIKEGADVLQITHAGTKGRLLGFIHTLLIIFLPFILTTCGTPTPTPTPISALLPPATIDKPHVLLPLPIPRYTIEKQTDISYGPQASEKLDLCYPVGPKGLHPGVLIIHGGGWTQGDKRGLGTYCTILAQQGFVTANINYRLADNKQPTTQWPAPLVDAQLAVRWLRRHASDLNLDPQRLCAWGTSAGGHLAVFLGALKKIHPGDEAQLFSDESPAVSCVLDYYGPTDLTQSFPLLTGQITTLLGGATLQNNPQLYHDASPLFNIAADTAPMVIVQGNQDTTVPPAQSQALFNALQKYNVPVQYISYNGGHSFHGLTSKQRISIDAQLFDYLIKHFQYPQADQHSVSTRPPTL